MDGQELKDELNKGIGLQMFPSVMENQFKRSFSPSTTIH